MNKKLGVFFLLSSMLLLLSQCKSDKKEILGTEELEGTCDTELRFNTIKPIIQLNCVNASCHNASASIGALITYQDLVKVIENGSFDSRVLSPSADMPLGSDWDSPESLEKVRCWVDNGFKE